MMAIPKHLTCLVRDLYTGQEATVRALYGITDRFKIEKEGCLQSPYLFNLHAEHIMRNARLDDLQVGIKIGGRNINNLRYVDDTTLMAEIKEELKSLLMKVKEVGERAGLRLNIKKKKPELGQTPGDGEGQGGLACCSPWGHKESVMTWRLNNIKLNVI